MPPKLKLCVVLSRLHTPLQPVSGSNISWNSVVYVCARCGEVIAMAFSAL